MTVSSIPTSNLHIGFVSTRLGTTDGVSLEVAKWSEVMRRLGHECYYFAGLCDRPETVSYVVPEAHFAHPAILQTYDSAFSHRERPPLLSREIRDIAEYLKEQLYEFVKKFDVHLLVVENTLAIPLNLPLGVALTEFIAESGIHTIGHHHDLYWERNRFLINCVWDLLDMCFPPRLPSIKHVAINSPAVAQLSYRRGIAASLIPNVMDFDNPPLPPDKYAATLKSDLKISSDEYLILQPTRIVQRKGIEHAMELVRRLQLPAQLVISDASGDEGNAYETYLRSFAKLLGVSTIFVSDIISDIRGTTPDGRKIYSLWDTYPAADIVTYPSLLEGFGNAFLEALYFRRPIVVNDYTIYAIDIKPKGFQAIELNGFVTDQAVAAVKNLLKNPSAGAEIADHNYQLAKRYYSYTFLEHQLRGLLLSFTGADVRS